MSAALTLIEAPELEPVTVAEAKAHARVDIDEEDSQFERWIIAARKKAEQYTRRQFITAEWRYRLDYQFPGGDGIIYVPLPPLQDVKEINYTGQSGTPIVVNVAEYAVDEATEPGRVYPAWSKSWPTPRPIPAAVRVHFHAGYGDEARDVPEEIRQAIMCLVSFWHENREAYSDNPFTFKDAPQAFFDLLREHRIPEFVSWLELAN